MGNQHLIRNCCFQKKRKNLDGLFFLLKFWVVYWKLEKYQIWVWRESRNSKRHQNLRSPFCRNSTIKLNQLERMIIKSSTMHLRSWKIYRLMFKKQKKRKRMERCILKNSRLKRLKRLKRKSQRKRKRRKLKPRITKKKMISSFQECKKRLTPMGSKRQGR